MRQKMGKVFKLVGAGPKGLWFNAYPDKDTEKASYHIRITKSGEGDTCDCPAQTHGDSCYHLQGCKDYIKEKELESILYG